MFVDIDLGKVGQADGVWEGAVVGALDFGGEVIGVGGDDDESGFEVFGEGVEDEMEGVFLVWSHEEREEEERKREASQRVWRRVQRRSWVRVATR